jgi:hypothetical protein
VSERLRVLARGLRRFGKLVVVCAGFVVLLSLVFGLLAGQPGLRAIALGFYITGSLLVIMAFFSGHQRRMRMDPYDPRIPEELKLQKTARDEREEALSVSTVLLALGLVLFVFGVLFDTRHSPL